jgi:cellulose synthase/poly-beta-1,6-N-acetylglucosamine synthase-like glycosyltransferase
MRGSALFLPSLVIGYALFTSIGILAVLGSLYSFYLGLVFDRKASLAISRPRTGFKPRVTAIMPCKGPEPNLERNMESLLKQDYGNYQAIVVSDSKEDPAWSVAASLLVHYPNLRVCISKPAASTTASGKVAALLTAIDETKRETEVYAFVDSDGFVPENWLSELVDPLIDKSIGASTGFRWYFPAQGGFWSHVEAAWNASGTNLLFDKRFNFPWGGGMAIRAETLEKIGIRKIWANAVSDDMTLNLALREHHHTIVFRPQCTVATFNQSNMHRFLEWATRQTTLTKAFNRRLWGYALAAYTFHDLTLLLGVIALFLAAGFDVIWLLPAVLLLSGEVLGIPRSLQRSRTFERAMPHMRVEFERNRLAEAMVSFIVPWIMTYCIIKSTRCREIEWRGRKYRITGMNRFATP